MSVVNAGPAGLTSESPLPAVAPLPTSVAPTAPAAQPTTLMKILGDAETALTILGEFGSVVPGISTVAAVGTQIDKVILAGLTARQAVVGAPLDLTKLQLITPV